MPFQTPQKPLLIIHAGFHKTGTTSIQSQLIVNRKRLAPYADVYVKGEMKSAFRAARQFRGSSDRETVRRFQTQFGNFLETLDLSKHNVLSMEGLVGVLMPSKSRDCEDIHDYAKDGIQMAKAMARAIDRTVGDKVETVFLYTTRQAPGFLKSYHAMALVGARMTLDLESFLKAHEGFRALEDRAADIARAVAPKRLEISRLEDAIGTKDGIAHQIWDLLDLPQELRATLKQPDTKNSAMRPEVLARVLEMNRRISSPKKLRRYKRRRLMILRLIGMPLRSSQSWMSQYRDFLAKVTRIASRRLRRLLR